MKDKHICSQKATPPEVHKLKSPVLVYKNTRLMWLPGYVALRFVHCTYPNDRALNYVEFTRTGGRMLTDAFRLLEAEGTLVPTDQTARILGKVKPSTQAEIIASDLRLPVAA